MEGMTGGPVEPKPPWAEFENLDGVIYSQVTVRDEWLEVSGRRIAWPHIVGLRVQGYASAGPGSAMDPMVEIFTADGEVVPVLARIHLTMYSQVAQEAAAGHDHPAARVAAAIKRLAPHISQDFSNWVGWRIPAAALAGAAAGAVLAVLAHAPVPVGAVSVIACGAIAAIMGRRWETTARRLHAARRLPGRRP
jgi:hypothetical protein